MPVTISELLKNLHAVTLPPGLHKYAGKIIDSDSHEMLPIQEWGRLFGEGIHPMADFFMRAAELEDINNSHSPGYPGDVVEIDANIGLKKGVRSPGAVDPRRRVAVMDALGIHRQFMIPSSPAMWASWLRRDAGKLHVMSFAKGTAEERRRLATRWMEQHNEVIMSAANISDRIRPVPMLFGDTVDEIIEHAHGMLKRGIRALWMVPTGDLPADVSPAHTAFDPLYALLAEANVPLILHAGAEGNFLRQEWDKAPHLAGHIRYGEFNRSPWYTAKMHLEAENFLTIMTVGGVFERHPRLRFGVIELCAYWVGPLMRRLDLWWGLDKKVVNTSREGAYRLSEPPSFYIKRNVRVTPFWFEDIGNDIEQFGLEDVYAFSTDYPHVEGGRNPAMIHYDKIVHLGSNAVEKYFVTNGQWLLPD